jgi:hypothetical protein
MFTDVELSALITRDFEESGMNSSKTDLSILVLTTGSWPLAASKTFSVLPNQLQVLKDSFLKYYGKNYTSRKLTWYYQLSKVDIKIMYTKRKYECNCTNSQLTVLLLFEDTPKWTTEEIIEKTQMERSELIGALKSLVDVKLLLVNSDETKSYTLNYNFASKRMRFKLGNNLFAETKGENDITKKAIQDDRKFFLQAVIVRIMKTRQRLKHPDLIQEVVAMSQSRFIPQVSFTKQCIETLIEKEYIARCGEGEYEYRA